MEMDIDRRAVDTDPIAASPEEVTDDTETPVVDIIVVPLGWGVLVEDVLIQQSEKMSKGEAIKIARANARETAPATVIILTVTGKIVRKEYF